MRWIVTSSVRLAAALSVAAAVLLVVAVSGLRHAAVDVLPEFLPPQVQVQTEALGLSAAEVEQLITVPMEDELNGLAYLDHVRSKSVPGLSVVELSFKPGTDVFRARQLVTERVAQGPALVGIGTPPVMVQPLSAESRAMMVALSSATMSGTDLSTLARWRIRPRLLAVPGVANVVIWGQRDQQLQVLADPVRMHRQGVTLSQVINTTGDAMWTSPLTFVEASSPGADGFIDTPNQRLSIQHILPISTQKDLAAVPVEDVVGRTVLLGDVATVVAGHPAMRGDAVLREGPGFLLVVEKLPGADPVAVAKGVQAAMAELKPGLTGVTVDTDVFRPATFVQSALRHLGWTALVGLVLLTAWLGLCWRSWRVALIAFVAITLPLCSAAYVLYLRGTTFTTMTLTGLVLAVGVVVDDAVRTADATGRTGRDGLVEACLAVRRPLGFALAAILLAAVPLLLLRGADGAFAMPMMTAYLLAVLVAAVVAVTVTPALTHLLLRRPAKPGRSRLSRYFDRAVAGFVGSGRLVYGTVALLAVCGILVLPQLGTGSLIPTMQDRSLLVRWQAPLGTSLPSMEQTAVSVGAALRAMPGVRDVATDLGQALMGDQPVDVNSAQTWITLSPDVDYGAAKAAIRRIIDRYPLQHTLLTYTEAALAADRTSAGPALTVRLYGTDPPTLAAQADRLRQAVAGVRDVVDPTVVQPVLEQSVQIATDVDAAAAHGLKPGDIRRATAVLLAGIPVGSYYQQQQIFDVAVWSDPALRRNQTDIENLPLDTPDGGQVALKEVAKVSERPAPAEVDHDQASRYLDVTADIRGGDLDQVLNRVRTAVQRVDLPVGYHAEVSSAKQQRQSAAQHTLFCALGGAVGIFLLMQAALRSWTRATLLFCTLPLAVAGGVVTAPLAGSPLTVGALVGFFAVFGLAVRGGLSLMCDIQRQEQEDPEGSRTDMTLRASRRAAFPTLVTAAGVTLAMLPFAVVGDIAGMEVVRPLALVVIGGLASSTLVTLFLLPALHLRLVTRTRSSART